MSLEQVRAGHAVSVLQGGAGPVALPDLPHHLSRKKRELISVCGKDHTWLGHVEAGGEYQDICRPEFSFSFLASPVFFTGLARCELLLYISLGLLIFPYFYRS